MSQTYETPAGAPASQESRIFPDHKSNAPQASIVSRRVFATSRQLEFCNIKELTTQTGHGPDDWPIVIVKELLDNALDACEEHSIAPEITVGIEADSITVADNGPGLSADTIDKIVD